MNVIKGVVQHFVSGLQKTNKIIPKDEKTVSSTSGNWFDDALDCPPILAPRACSQLKCSTYVWDDSSIIEDTQDHMTYTFYPTPIQEIQQEKKPDRCDPIMEMA